MSVVEAAINPLRNYGERRLVRKKGYEELRKSKSEERGYTINPKYITISFLAEFMVIGTSLFGAYLFATKYTESGHLSWADFWMMMLAPFSYAVIEMCRVPLALSFRTQRNYFIKLLAFIGVIAAAGVTVKSMSQLGEIMFRPRLIEVTEAKHALNKVEATRANFQGQYDLKKASLDMANQRLSDVQKSITEQSDTLKQIGKPQMCPGPTVVRSGRRVAGPQVRCRDTAATTTVANMLKDQGGQLQLASADVKAARDALDKLGTSETMEAEVVKAQGIFDTAVMHSQLHAFTGMFFGRSPSEVTDGELSAFLRIFVFVPAICVSLSSTLLAMAAVNKVKSPAKDPNAAVNLHPDAAAYLLDPFAQEIVQKATDAARQEIRESLDNVRPIHPNTTVSNAANPATAKRAV